MPEQLNLCSAAKMPEDFVEWRTSKEKLTLKVFSLLSCYHFPTCATKSVNYFTETADHFTSDNKQDRAIAVNDAGSTRLSDSTAAGICSRGDWYNYQESEYSAVSTEVGSCLVWEAPWSFTDYTQCWKHLTEGRRQTKNFRYV